jgi:pimeloyl-ACP methyl ester carboxylesterase
MKLARQILQLSFLLLLVVYAGIVMYAYLPFGENIPIAELATPDDLFIEVDGMQLRYREWGEQRPDRPSIVFIHGFANSQQSFKKIAPYLANEYHVVAMDLPGFGLSAKPTDHDYGNESQARVIADLITALNLKTALVGGHSLGGALALRVALTAPQVRGLILFNPGIITTGVPAVTEYLVFPLPRLAARTFGTREFREGFLRNSYLDPAFVTDEVIDELMLSPRSEGYIEGTTALMGYYRPSDEVELMADVKVPTLIIWGAQDKRKPAGEAETLRDGIPGSRLIVIPDAAHYVHEEKPEVAARAIIEAKDFWATTSPSQ